MHGILSVLNNDLKSRRQDTCLLFQSSFDSHLFTVQTVACANISSVETTVLSAYVIQFQGLLDLLSHTTKLATL